MTPKLLCTFTTLTEVNNLDILSEIIAVYAPKRLFIYSYKDEENTVIITYNPTTEKDLNNQDLLLSTTSLHRKKETNTLYSLNAMNSLINEVNDTGVQNKNYQLDWTHFKDTLIIKPRGASHKIIPLSYIKCIDTQK